MNSTQGQNTKLTNINSSTLRTINKLTKVFFPFNNIHSKPRKTFQKDSRKASVKFGVTYDENVEESFS